MARSRRSLRERLEDFLDELDDDDDPPAGGRKRKRGDDDEETTITVRGKAAEKLLGLLGVDDGKGDDGEGGAGGKGGDGKNADDDEGAPDRGKTYFKDGGGKK